MRGLVPDGDQLHLGDVVELLGLDLDGLGLGEQLRLCQEEVATARLRTELLHDGRDLGQDEVDLGHGTGRAGDLGRLLPHDDDLSGQQAIPQLCLLEGAGLTELGRGQTEA